MDVYWRGPDSEGDYQLYTNTGRFCGLLYPTRGECRWYNSPHEMTKFTSATLDEAKQIALSIWALQESVGVS
jgi:hypothetical protein